MTDYSVQLTLLDGSTTVLHCCVSSPSTESRRLVRTIRTTEVVQVGPRQEVVLAASICPGRGAWTYHIAPLSDERPSARYTRFRSRSTIIRVRSKSTMIARASTDGLAEDNSIRLLNSTTRPLHLPRGTAVAEFSVIPKYPELPQDSGSQSTADLQVRSTVAKQDEFPAKFPEVLKPLVQSTSVDTPGQR